MALTVALKLMLYYAYVSLAKARHVAILVSMDERNIQEGLLGMGLVEA